MPVPVRPRFKPSQCSDLHYLDHPSLSDKNFAWIPLLSCPASFPYHLFEAAVSQLIYHPEYNSTLILRSDTISESIVDFPSNLPQLANKRPCRVIHRRLLARRPGRDGNLEQYCFLYTSSVEGAIPDTLVLTPIVEPGGRLPYYHPTVVHLAFRYLQSDFSTLRIEVVPLEGTALDPGARLYRTCLVLLDTVDRYGWGALTNYKKRVVHDCFIPREQYQDLYLIMRERHKHLINTWQEVTDPLKHVFEDIGIATFLMLLWKESYPSDQHLTWGVDPSEPWKSWPRPPGGFLDFGCGNGLLTHILVTEGYEGRGVDLRSRTSWTHYPEATRASLHVYTFDPSTENPPYFNSGVFIIGNHADELTPWVPLLSTLYSASGYLSIPCCAWSFDSKYDRSTTPMFPTPRDNFADTLNLGEGGNSSSYSMYRIWLATLSLHCGWEVECDVLRIPSTRNWAIVGRRRSASVDWYTARENVERILNNVNQRGIYKARKPEGKDH